jgi:hypothetical protein
MLDTKTEHATFATSTPTPAPSPSGKSMPTICPARPVAPDIYRGKVVSAEIVAYAWRSSPRNPDGLAVRIAVSIVDEIGDATVFDACDLSHLEKLVGIYSACGITPPASPTKAIESLVGRPCRVVTKNIRPRVGKHSNGCKAVVSAWLSCS